jgi:hypothetical protein
MAPSMYDPSVTEGEEIEERYLEDEIVVTNGSSRAGPWRLGRRFTSTTTA